MRHNAWTQKADNPSPEKLANEKLYNPKIQRDKLLQSATKGSTKKQWLGAATALGSFSLSFELWKGGCSAVFFLTLFQENSRDKLVLRNKSQVTVSLQNICDAQVSQLVLPYSWSDIFDNFWRGPDIRTISSGFSKSTVVTKHVWLRKNLSSSSSSIYIQSTLCSVKIYHTENHSPSLGITLK